jgi:transposase InsO family protein
MWGHEVVVLFFFFESEVAFDLIDGEGVVFQEERVAKELHPVIAQRGLPKMIVIDSSTEFTSNAILNWADEAEVEWH